jgi:GNAT superfamily N-acetyltransferase
MTRSYLIELARAVDIPALPHIEREAVTLFETGLIPASVLEETTPIEELQAAYEAGLLWVARTPAQVVGFALVELLDGGPHLEEIDVHPDYGRGGVGRALMHAVMTWAREAGHSSITLTTFRDVPWNAPFYAQLGFRTLEPAELTPGLEVAVQNEIARGFDPSRRVVMRCDLGRAP